MNTNNSSLEKTKADKLKSFFTRNALAFLAFILPVLIMLLAFAAERIYPFGSNQIAIIDMYHQYVPFLSELQDKLQNGGSLFYTWNGAGGSNFWCLLSYYGASPLNLILILFPAKMIMEGVTIVLLIKIGLCGSFMFINLRDQRKSDLVSACGFDQKEWIAVAFSCLYALNSYVMGYFWCIMWMDAVMLLPLCIMGLRRLIQGKGIALYTVTLALIVFCNYYIAIMVCIFILVYYPVLYFTRPGRDLVIQENLQSNRKLCAVTCAKTTGKAVGASLLGLAMAGVMLLPTYLSMQSTYYISSDMPEQTSFYNDPLNIINQLLPNAELTYRDGLPNLYCGMLTVIMLVIFILLKNIPARDKIINGAFLVLMFFSLNINKLDFIWHGFHFPNELPYRYSFVICFVLLGLGYRAIQQIDSIRTNVFYGILAAGVGYYLIADKILVDKLDSANVFFYAGVALLVLYTAVLALHARGKAGRTELTALLVAIVVAEMCFGTCTSMHKAGNSDRSSYQDNFDSVTSLVDYVDQQPFARTETDSQVTINEPARMHFKGVSQFSSALNAGTTGLMEEIGLEGEPGKNRFNYNLTNPVTNAMLNIKYIIAKESIIEDSNFKEIRQEGESRLYENKYPLSIGYVVPDTIRTWDYESGNPYENLNDYVRAATGGLYGTVFEELGQPQIESEYASVEYLSSDCIDVYSDDSSNQSVVILQYTAQKTDNHYVYIETANAESIFVERDNEAENVEIENDCGSIVNIGKVEAGETFDIRITYNMGVAGSIESHVCTLDHDTWEKAYDCISQNMMTVTDYSDTSLTGTVDVDESGVLVLSIPYDKGWTLKVDGKKKNITDLTGDVWISTALDEGTHQIELNFRPPGLIPGLCLTILSILFLIALTLWKRKRAKNLTMGEDENFPDPYSSYKPPEDFIMELDEIQERQEETSSLTTEDISSNGI